MKFAPALKTAGLISAVVFGLTACSETPQTARAAYKKSDSAAWQGTGSKYMSEGWKPGDATSWEEHLRTRAQGQNDYSRVR